MPAFYRPDGCSEQEKMEIRLGKVQVVKAIDDGGVSMFFRRELGTGSEQSRRTILSVEVIPLIPVPTSLTYPGKAEKARKGERPRHSKSPCLSNIRRNARSSLSFRFLRDGQ